MLYSENKLKKAKDLLMIAHAYAGGATCGHYSGGAHLIVTADFTRGRLVRKAGDPLCKPHSKFWGLEPEPDYPLTRASCKKCKEIAERLGLLADPQDERRWLLRVLEARMVDLQRPVEVDFHTKNSHYRVNFKEHTVECLSPRPFPPRKVMSGINVFRRGPEMPKIGHCYYAMWAESKAGKLLQTTRVISIESPRTDQ